MRIFNEAKTNEIQKKDIDFSQYKLKKEKLFIRHHNSVDAVDERSHYEVNCTYPNGGKDIKKIIDFPRVQAKDAYDEYEDIYCLVPLTLDERKNYLRELRTEECFSIINRGKFWYNSLTSMQEQELAEWYRKWLDVTQTLVAPTKPIWIK